MHLLLDTHILLWALDRPSRLNAAFRDAISDQRNVVLFSAMSILEIAIKSSLGRPDFGARPEDIRHNAEASGFVELPLCAPVACRVADLPFHHRDPFDRLLVAQAIAEPARLLTSDALLTRYSELVWLLPD